MREFVLLLVEGDADLIFYNAVVNELKKMAAGTTVVKLKNMRGIGNYNKDAVRYLDEYRNANKIKNTIKVKVVMSYDHDVFSNKRQRPPINRCKIESYLRAKNAEVIHVVARESIEDWFMADKNGLEQYLGKKLSNKDLQGKGQDVIKKLMKTHKCIIYTKGAKAAELVNKLDIKAIMSKKCSEISSLCQAVGVKCLLNGSCKRE